VKVLSNLVATTSTDREGGWTVGVAAVAILWPPDSTFTRSILTTSSRVGFSVRDVITDFTHNSDKVDVAGIDADTGHGRDQAFHWVGSAAFSNGHPGELGYFLSSTATVIHGSTDGDSADEFQIQLTGPPTLAATDIVL